MRQVLRILKWLGVLLLLVIVAAVGWSFYVLNNSQPILEGEIVLQGLRQPVTIDRDSSGVPVISAADRRDAAYATGFLHAQERFFQMDIARRVGAGELAVLFGDNILPIDRNLRRHRLRRSAEQALSNLPADQRRLLDNYVIGVNAGLKQLNKAPLEYTVLGAEPLPWTATDSLLVIMNMYVLLQDFNGEQDYARHVLYHVLPGTVADFLSAEGNSDWDAPLQGTALALPAMPGPGDISLREQPPTAFIESRERAWISGSNAWAMSGAHTADGAAIIANDMHLGFFLPNTFYRIQMQISASSMRLTGVSLPGIPTLVAGSNGHIAWGFTNSAGDWSDTVLLEDYDPESRTYQSADGRSSVETVTESIEINGDDPEAFEIEVTPWGPVYQPEQSQDHYAIRWVAQEPEAVNLGLLRLEQARTVSQALDAAPAIGIPQQNIMVGDAQGSIGWSIAGRIPVRTSGDGRLPLDSSQAGPVWSGWLSAADYPRIENPPDGRLWTANARVVDGPDLDKIGHGYYVLGARARQIRDSLHTLDTADEQAMLAIQMDHRALFLQRWHGLMQTALANGNVDDELDQLAQILAGWDGAASRDSVAYPYVRRFRERVFDHVFAPYVSMLREYYPQFELEQMGDQYEGPLWALLNERPLHLLPARFASWDELLQTALQQSARDVADGGSLDSVSWGEQNRLSMRHPMSAFIPGFAWLFDMPADELDGDRHMPLALRPEHGPVQRMVVRPGSEQAGLLSIPGGQASNPRVPYYGSGQQAWLEGAPVPLLAGESQYQLRLTPL